MVASNNPFYDKAPLVYNNGYSVIPGLYGQKRPRLSGYNQFFKERPSKEQMQSWDNLGVCDLIICTGAVSGIVGLDFDYDKDNRHAEILSWINDILPQTIQKKGHKGRTVFFRYNGEKTRQYQKNGECIIEVLADNKMSHIPPSRHDHGMDYVYLSERTFENTKPNELPYLPSDFIEKLNNMFGVKERAPVERSDEAVEVPTIQRALQFVSSDSYELWLQVGMAIKSELGDEGFSLWDQWSSTSNKYNKEETWTKWYSFNSDGISIGTLFKHALDNGFVFLPNEKKPVDDLYDIDKAFEIVESWRVNGREIGDKTGIASFDSILHIRKEELTVVTGYTNHGKSTFLDYLLFSMAKNLDYQMLIVSPESKVPGHVESFMHRYTNKPIEYRGKEEQIEAIKFIKSHFMFRDNLTYGTEINDIVQSAKVHYDKTPYNILVVDPFNKIECREVGDNIYRKVQVVCNNLSSLAKQLGIHVFLVAHPRTTHDMAKPTSQTIAGGADFSNIADNLIVVTRAESGITEVDIPVIREQDIDTPGSLQLKYNSYTRLYDEVETKYDFKGGVCE